MIGGGIVVTVMPAAERIDWTMSRAPRRAAIVMTVLQVWAVAAYLVTGPVPYFWPGLAYESLVSGGVPEWLLVVPGLLFAMPGFWVAGFGEVVGALLAAAGATVWIICRHLVSARLATWLAGGTVLTAALLIFSVTPLGTDIQIWVLD